MVLLLRKFKKYLAVVLLVGSLRLVNGEKAKRTPAASHVGKKFNRWTINRVYRKDGVSKAEAKCDCGMVKEVNIDAIIRGASKSCGCYRVDFSVSRHTRHGLSGSATWNSWYAMKQRCYYKNRRDFHLWGGRGIKVCTRWLECFDNFLEDMGECPPGLTLDRIDNNGHYEPGNCRWATRSEQVRNRRTKEQIASDMERYNSHPTLA